MNHPVLSLVWLAASVWMALACKVMPPSVAAAGLAGVLSLNLPGSPLAVSGTVVYVPGAAAVTSHGVVSHYHSDVENEVGTGGRTLLVEPDPRLGETGRMRLVEDLSPLLQLQLILTPVGLH